MNKLIFFLIERLDKVLKKNKTIVFSSFPEYSDNSYAIFRYMMLNKEKYKEFLLVWIVNKDKKKIEEKIFKEFGKKIKVVSKASLEGFYYYVKSSLVFYTHGIYGYAEPSDKKIRVNLWHGMPLKTIARLNNKEYLDKKQAKCKFTISTSKTFSLLMSKAFSVAKNDVLLSGNPRNDLLFEKTNFYKGFNLVKTDYNKIILWMPTYRSCQVGKIRTDGDFSSNKISLLEMNDLKELNEILARSKNLLLIKLHPMDELNNFEFLNYSNIKIIKSNDLEEKNIQLYPFLGSCDVLITDYSSVYIDFDILKKPIIFAMDDFESYRNSRGFAVEGNIEDYMPGKIIKTSEELITVLKKGEYNYKSCKKELNKFKDNKSCERLLEALKII